jgi:hypothetical protein
VGTTVWPSEGSTLWSGSGWSYSAYQRYIFYYPPSSATSGTKYFTTLTADIPSPACYSIAGPFLDNTYGWGEYFFFGGPGGGSCQ